MLHVPYSGANNANIVGDLLNNRIQVYFPAYPTVLSAKPTGKIKLLAVFQRERVTHLPDLPTVNETVPNNKIVPSWFGFMGPAQLPQPIVMRLQSEIKKALGDQEVSAKLQEIGIIPVGNAASQMADALRDRDSRCRPADEGIGNRAELGGATCNVPLSHKFGCERSNSEREEAMRVLKSMLAAVAALCLLIAASARAEPVKIRNAYVVPVANWAPMLEAKKDLAKHWGKSYTMEAVRFAGTPPMITALANNELEIANLAYSTLGLAIQNAGLSDLRIIADEFQDGAPGYFSNQYWVRKDSGINRIRISRARSSPPTRRAAASTSR